MDIRKEKIYSKRQLDIYWDDIVSNYYLEKFKNLSIKELDNEFNNSLKTLTKYLTKLNDQEKQYFVDLFARVIEFYIENKVEKEISNSFSTLLKLK